MAKVNINFDGDAARAQFAKAKKQAVHAIAIDAQNEITSQLNRGSSNRGKTPSPPGQPPHRDTAALANSWQLDISQLGEPNPKARVASNLPYAAVHEWGNRTHPARPYARPAVANVNQRAADIALPFFREAASNIQRGNT